MKLVTNKVPVILNGMHPVLKDNGTPDWSKVVMLESGTVLKIMAVSFNALHTFENILYQESKKYKGANEPYVFSQQYDLCSIKFSERGVGIRIGLY